MTTKPVTTPNRSNPLTFRKDTTEMHAFELRLAEAHERQALLRAIRDADRRAERSARSIRLRLGSSLIAMGRRIGGDAMNHPAWQG
jgi:hypothetical protein